MKNLYLLLCFCVGATCLNAQASLSISTQLVSNSTPALGTQISVLTNLTNVSTVDTFNGIINFSLANKDSIITNLNVVGYPNYAGTAIKLAPQEHRAALFTVQLLPSYFAVGPDIIIVWPIAANTNIIDSANAPINIIGAVGINNLVDNGPRLFVANEKLYIQNSGVETGPEQVRIFDLLGRTVLTSRIEQDNAAIPLGNLPQGVYVAEVVDAAGRIKAVKFVR